MVYSSESNTCVQAIWYVIVMKWLIEPAAVALAIIIVIVAIVLFGAFYFRATQPALVTPTPVPVDTTVTEIPTPVLTTVPETNPPTPEIQTPSPAPTQRGTYAESATPIRDPNPYKLPYYSTVYNPKGQYFPTIFHQSYEFNFQYEAVYANVVKAPLIIDFAVTPGSSTPIRSFFLITVRDNTTQKLLAQDGYFRTYSSNSPKRLYFSSPGMYHINMYGGFVNADLTLRAPTS
ncbi:MAG: hypothetical protein LUQ32_10955 [Methanomicrobiales archaeon]|nr:hypothetical protein [Methanomicrobiales archaeon]